MLPQILSLFLAQDFQKTVHPVLMEHCSPCHGFMKTATANSLQENRGRWRNVAAQLRNRTMPPRDSRLNEEDRLRIAAWIESKLHDTACQGADFAGAAVTRRLNRREFQSTVRDLFGIEFELTSLLPADGTGGAGFDTNGETLYVPPALLERYLEVAQQIVDRAIVTPALRRTFTETTSATLPIYLDGEYDIAVAHGPLAPGEKLALQIDGGGVAPLKALRRANNAGVRINLNRGNHQLRLIVPGTVRVDSFAITQKPESVSHERKATHHRLLGIDPGDRPSNPRRAAKLLLESLLPRAFRRPVHSDEVARFLTLYDRAAERQDPYEERVKLMLKAVLVWPEFLFRIEKRHAQPGIHPLTPHELATRLSYFFWSSPPDDTLRNLADSGRLSTPAVLREQTDRMLDHPRSRAFVSSFIGQWLGTQDIGGRVVPLLTEIQSYYTPEIAADLKAQPVMLFDRILDENRSVLELIDANYTHLNARLANFYQIEDRVRRLPADNEFQVVTWPDKSRAGLLGLAGVLAMTSRYQETSPVLRGAWVLDTLLGTPVPPPPADVPPLPEHDAKAKLTMREKLTQHRADAACAACHRLMDPIGFGLEEFDWMGRWRDREADGKPVDASGQLPSGETFKNAAELRAALLAHKKEFLENLVSRLMGYALGRSMQDGDNCTVQRIVEAVQKDGYKARTLIREIVTSVPFLNTQGGVSSETPSIETRRSLDVSKLNATRQDATSHNNQVKVLPKPSK